MASKESKARVAKAFRAMKELGISQDKVKPVLKSLLKVFEKNWELIEEENYRALADAIFEREESEAVKQSKKFMNTQAEDHLVSESFLDQELERPLKRLRRMSQDGPASSSRISSVPQTSLLTPKEEKDELPEPALLSPSQNVMPSQINGVNCKTKLADTIQQYRGKGKQAGSTKALALLENRDAGQPNGIIRGQQDSPSRIESGSSSHSLGKGQRGNEYGPRPVESMETRSGHENSSLALKFKEPKIEPITSVPANKKSTQVVLMKPKEEPVFDDLVGVSTTHPNISNEGDSSRVNKSCMESYIQEPLESLPANRKEVHTCTASQYEPKDGSEMFLSSSGYSTSLEVASSPSGEVKMLISLNLDSERNTFRMPKLEAVLNAVQDMYLQSNITGISVSKILSKICENFLELGTHFASGSTEPSDLVLTNEMLNTTSEKGVQVSTGLNFSDMNRSVVSLCKPDDKAPQQACESLTNVSEPIITSEMVTPASTGLSCNDLNRSSGSRCVAEAGVPYQPCECLTDVSKFNSTSEADVQVPTCLGLNPVNGSVDPLREAEVPQQSCNDLAALTEPTKTSEADAQVSTDLDLNPLKGSVVSPGEAEVEISYKPSECLTDVTEPSNMDIDDALSKDRKCQKWNAEVFNGETFEAVNRTQVTSERILAWNGAIDNACDTHTDDVSVEDGKDHRSGAEVMSVLTVEVVQKPQMTSEIILALDGALDIAKGKEKSVITVVNDVNDELPPAFCYITQNAAFQNAHVDFSLSHIRENSCCASCSGDCLSLPSPCACARRSGGKYPYTNDGLLKDELLRESVSMDWDPKKHCKFFCKKCPVERSKYDDNIDPCKGHLLRKIIKECSLRCGCGNHCGNRIVQRGVTRNLQVFMTSEGKGWGLRALEDLPKGAFVCEYVGEILTITELLQRALCHQNGKKLWYPMFLDAAWGPDRVLKDRETLSLDATYYGNISRFINHRCYDANLVAIPVEVESPDHHYYHLAFFTTRKVNAMEELTRDYGIDFDDYDHTFKTFECRCGSKFCRNIKRARSRCARR